MSLKRLSSWQAVAVMVPGALMVAFIAVAVVRSKPSPAGSSARPQSAVVMSYGLSPTAFGDSCGGVAVVRLKDGEEVRAASGQNAYLQKGTPVTVIERRSSCPPASYTVLHAGQPDGPVNLGRTPLRGAGAG